MPVGTKRKSGTFDLNRTVSHHQPREVRSPRFLAPLAAVLLISCAVGLSACSSPKVASKKLDPFAGKGSPIYPGKGPLPKGGGRYHVGKPYEVAGQKFTPREDPNYDAVGVASWYGEAFHRRMTSNGEWFDMNDLTAAHTTLPLPSYAKVTNLTNGKSLIVRVNDRGPFVNDRIIDLSRRSAEVLEVKNKGTAKVRVQYVGPAPLNDKGEHLMAMNEELRRGTPMKYMIASADMRAGRGGGGGAAPAPVMVARAEPAPQPGRHEPKPAQVPFAVAKAEPAPRPVLSASSAPVMANAAPAVSAPQPAQQSAGGAAYYIQAAALSSAENAERARNLLASLGPVEISTLETATSRLFRVRVGPLSDPRSADATLQNVRAAGYADARIVPASY